MQQFLLFISAFCLTAAYGWWGVLASTGLFVFVVAVSWREEMKFRKNMEDVFHMINRGGLHG